MMTPNQKELFDFIVAYVAEHGMSPTYSTIAGALGYSSKSKVHQRIESLIDRGFLRRLGSRGRARGIEVVRMPNTGLGTELEAAVAAFASSHKISRETVIREAVRAWVGLVDVQ